MTTPRIEYPNEKGRKEKIEKGAEDFARRFEGVMRDLSQN